MCSTQNDSWVQTFHSEQFVNKLENSDPIFQNTWVETILAVSIHIWKLTALNKLSKEILDFEGTCQQTTIWKEARAQ